ncbi:MAG: hypothetical protein IV090_14795 [Candidatus Sericytochromatia bacterium]|nr:hypothetical protein [Candidatus Sericytochromatia bacterium]
MEMNRSGFLKKILGEALQVLPHVVPALNLIQAPFSNVGPLAGPQANAGEAEERPRPWQEVGGWADFPPGTQTPVNQGQHIVVAFERGLYALDSDLFHKGEAFPRRPLRIEPHGQISLNQQAFWPGKDYLSHLTGNRNTEEET